MNNGKQAFDFKVAAFCLLGFVANFIACYPGYMTGDSLDQYAQSLSAEYSNWHPPIMAAWWRVLNIISSGPQSMLAFQLACLWVGIYFLFSLLRGSKWWYLTVFLFAFAPFVQNFSGYIIKDSQMAITWFLACAWMLHISGRRRNWLELIACTLLLVYGCWIRLNALPGFIPLCFLWAGVFFPFQSDRIKIIAAFSFLVATVLLQPLVNYKMLRASKSYPEIKLYMHDLSGVFVRTGENVFPALLYQNSQFDTAFIRKHYSVTSFDPIWWNDNGIKVVNGDKAPINAALYEQWTGAIFQHPGIYLSNRFNGFLYYLRVRNSGTKFYYNINFIDENKWGFAVRDGKLHRFWQQGLKLHGAMPYTRPWFWLLLNLVLFIPLRRMEKGISRVAATCLLWSSLLYVLPMFFLFQVDFEFRYSYWNCIAVSLGLCMIIKEKLRGKITPEL